MRNRVRAREMYGSGYGYQRTDGWGSLIRIANKLKVNYNTLKCWKFRETRKGKPWEKMRCVL